jgi:multidrug efflux pump subunit AcrB
MEELAHKVLPKGVAFEWTELAFQQQRGTPNLLVFGAAALLVFLVFLVFLVSSSSSPNTKAGNCRWRSS